MRRPSVVRLVALAALVACSDSTAPPWAIELVVTAQPSSAQSGVALTAQPVVRLRYAGGVLTGYSGFIVTATTTATGVTVVNGTATFNASGEARFDSLTLSGPIGAVPLRFRCGRLEPVDVQPVALTAGPPAQIAIAAQPPAAAAAGIALTRQPIVQLRDGAGNAVSQSGIVVTAAIASGGGTLGGTTTATTSADGVATFTDLLITGTIGPRTLSFSAPALTGATSGTITLSAGAASQLAITTQPSTSAQSCATLAQQPAVQLQDASGNPVTRSGTVVSVSIASGGGTLGGATTAATSASGVATFTDLSITGVTGDRTLGFGAPSLASATSGTITLAAGTASRLVITTEPSTSVWSGTPFAQQPVVQLQDPAGNAVGLAGAVVTASIVSGGGTLGGTTAATTSAGGAATFTDLLIAGTIGPRTLSFSALALTSATSGTITLAAGTASQLAITTEPSIGAQSGVAFAEQPVVQLQDVSGNAVTQSGAVVTAAIGSGGGTLGGTTVASTDANGVAAFTDLQIMGVIGVRTLDFSGTGLTGATSGPITLSAGTASQLLITTEPSTSAQSGVALVQQPAVQLQDAAGNTVGVAGVAITAAIASGGGTLGGTTTAVTSASGVATFSNLSITGAVGARTLSLSATGLTGVTSGTITLTAGAGTQIAASAGEGQSATVGTAVATPPSVIVRDGDDNPVAGVSVTFEVATGGGSVTSGATTTDPSGIAAVESWTLGTTAGANTLTATSAGMSGSPVTFTATGTAGTATQIEVSAGNGQSASVGTAVATAPSVIVRDGNNNPVSDVSVTFAVATGGGTVMPATAVVTGVDGIAAVTSWTLGTAAGANTLTATSGGLSGSPVTFAATGTAGAATQIAVSAGNGQIASAGTAVAMPPAVVVRDGHNNPVSGVAVTFAVATGGGSVTGGATTTNASGIAAVGSWTLGTTPGANTLRATATGLIGSPVTFTATGIGPATQIAANAGNGQSAVAGTAVATPPAVVVRDVNNNPVSGVSVTFAVGTGGGSVAGGATTTDASGVATVGSWTLGATAGANTLLATATGLTGSPVTFTATGTAGAATQIAVSAGNAQSATAGALVPTPPAVVVRDANNNAVSGVSVTFAVATGGGTVVPTTAVVTGATGSAAVTSWRLGTTAGANTLTATATGLTGSPVTFTATGTAGAATQVAVSAGNGQSATVGTVVPTPPAAVVRDVNGNPVSGVSVTFAVATGGGTVVPTTAVVTGATGVAAVTSWRLGTTAGANTLTATAAGLTGSPVTFTATGTAGAATQIAVSAGNGQSATAGTAVATPPAVVVRDVNSNPVGGVSVAFAVATGGGTVVPTTAVVTGATGIAAVTSWTLGTTAGANTLTATAAGLTGSPVTITATGTAGAATQIAVSAGNGQSATVGTVVPTPPAVVVRDVNNNAVSGVSVTFAVATGGGTVVPTAAVVTGATGIAAVTSWRLGTTAGANTLTATAAGLAGSPVTFTATGTAGAATQIAVSAGNGQSAVAGTAVATPPAVLVRDANSNPVSGVSVTFAVATGGGTVVPTTAVVTGVNGIAAVTSWRLGTTVGANTLRATATGLAGSPVTFTATGTAGAATQIAVSAGNAQSATAGAVVTTPPAVVVRDVNNNAVSGVSVTFAVATGGGTVVPTTAVVTGATGIAAVTSWRLGTTAGANTLTATATGLTGSPVTFTATGTAGAATQVAISAGNGQSATVGTPVPTRPSVVVRDVNNNPVSGFRVTFAVATGGGSVTGGTATTNAGGIATVGSWTLGTTAGANTLRATATGLTGSPVTFTATGTAGAATQIARSAGNGQSAVAGTAVTTPPAVLVRDGHNNPVSGVSVTFAVATGGGTVVPTTAVVTGVNGIAAVTSWTLGTTAGANTLTATATGLTGSPVTFTATGTAGAATQIAVNAGNGQSATVGTVVPTRPSVVVRDVNNNPVSGVSVTFAVATGGGTVVPTTAVVTGATGIATVTSWRLGTTAGANTLRATAAGLTGSPVTFTATGTAGAATRLALTGQPSTTAAGGAPLASQPVVQVQDANGNLVSQTGTVVTATVVTGPGTLTNATATTAGGVATFSGLTLSGSRATYTLRFGATGLTSVTAAQPTALATRLSLTTQPSTAANSGVPLATQPVVQLRDVNAGAVAVANVVVTASVVSGSATITAGGTATTDATGKAAFTGLTLTGTGSVTLRFTFSGDPLTAVVPTAPTVLP